MSCEVNAGTPPARPGRASLTCRAAHSAPVDVTLVTFYCERETASSSVQGISVYKRTMVCQARVMDSVQAPQHSTVGSSPPPVWPRERHSDTTKPRNFQRSALPLRSVVCVKFSDKTVNASCLSPLVS